MVCYDRKIAQFTCFFLTQLMTRLIQTTRTTQAIWFCMSHWEASPSKAQKHHCYIKRRKFFIFKKLNNDALTNGNDIHLCPRHQKVLTKGISALTLLKSLLCFTDNDYHRQHLPLQMFNLPQLPRISTLGAGLLSCPQQPVCKHLSVCSNTVCSSTQFRVAQRQPECLEHHTGLPLQES